jgi:hypothetical protein
LNVHVTGVAKDQGFPLAGSHNLYPLRFLSTWILLQVLERPDMVYLDFVGGAGGSALFTRLGEQSLLQF